MHIIDTGRKDPKSQIPNPKLQIIFLSLFMVVGVLIGCGQKADLEKAKQSGQKSAKFYQEAVNEYKALINRGKDLDQLHFELGLLYYTHGDFTRAIAELKNSPEPKAKKFLAISYYRLGNFTDALERFAKVINPDEESIYYHGLTCEKLNLYDQALKEYRAIKEGDFVKQALGRIEVINKDTTEVHIRDIDPLVAKLLDNAPTEEKYPQAGALILYADEKNEITPQNTEIDELHYVIKILNERGKENYAEAQIEYDSTFEKVELEFARTIKPDGTLVEVGSRHTRDVSKYLNYPLYSNARVFIISFPEIAQQAAIEYKVKVFRNQLINKKDFVMHYSLQANDPVILADFTLAAPQGKKFNFRYLNDWFNNYGANLAPTLEKKNGAQIYRWSFKDIPQIIPEANMPPNVEINPTFLVSTFNDWQEIYDWWWLLAKDKMKPDDAIKSKVKELIKDKVTPEEKARSIYNFCAKEIRYVAIEYGDAGYEPHFAADIFRNKYGDCKDQAVLLVTMLQEAGLKGKLVLIGTREYYNLEKDFPNVLFNHCIAAVVLKDRQVFLDPTAETCSFDDLPTGDQDRRVLTFSPEKLEIESTPLYPADHNFLRQRTSISISERELISAKKTISTTGAYDQMERYWLLYTAPDIVRETLSEKIQQLSIGAMLERYTADNLNDLNTPVVLSYEFNGPEFFTVAGALRIMPQLAEIDTSLTAKPKRKYPIDFGMLDIFESEYEFNLPPGFTIMHLPANVVEDSPWLTFNVEYEKSENKIIFKQRASYKKVQILQDEYPAFKFFYENIAKKIKQRIVLQKNR